MTSHDVFDVWAGLVHKHTRGGSCNFQSAAKELAELAAAAEREACAKRRGVLMFNPYTGSPRHPSDIASDPHGILLLDPEQAIRASSET